MKGEERAYFLNMESIFNYILDDEVKDSESEITELYVMNDETKNMSLKQKQLREVKSGDLTTSQSCRYEMVKLLLDKLLDIENEELTFGQTVIVNTLLTEGLITEIK